ncbi:hypothetical protein R3I93_012122 [Phoxinus phoxinus]|uniref:Uncharacterized protein n=1 Tax=Phoxinus phoxinus TaxID=58324 RepID=A0AAN9H431_9TELE
MMWATNRSEDAGADVIRTYPEILQSSFSQMEEFMLLELKTFPTLYHRSESNASPSSSLFTSSAPGMAYLLTQSTGSAEHE